MSRELRARIGAARILLEGCVGQPTFPSASRLQALALCEIVKKSNLSIQERAEVQSLVAAVRWVPEDLQAILVALEPSQPKTVSRNAMQDFTNLHEYFTEEEWIRLGNESLGMSVKMDTILGRVISLGCRCPSEPTVKRMTSLMLAVAEPREKLGAMSSEQKLVSMRHLKNELKRRVRNALAPSSYVVTLPGNPADLKAVHPQLFMDAFGEQMPVPSRVDIQTVISMDNKTAYAKFTIA